MKKEIIEAAPFPTAFAGIDKVDPEASGNSAQDNAEKC